MYGSPQPQQSKDLNLPYPAPPQESNIFHRHQQQQQQQMSSGLLRYRSAPSSLLAEVCDDFLPVRPSSPETENIFARFLAPDLDKPTVDGGANCSAIDSSGQRSSQFEQAAAAQQHQLSVYQQQQQLQGSMEQIKSNSSNLIRQNSSPAGLFSHLNVDSGFGMIRGIGGFRNANSPSGDSGNRLKGQLSFSSRQNSIMSQISEVGSEGMDASSPEESGGAGRSFLPGFPIGAWDESSMLSESNFSGLKRGRDGEVKILGSLNSAETQSGEVRNHVSGLTHQFSLPKTSSEMAAIEKFLQLQDAVPCKIRAKRGCATHPRSIAERVRRTRISERMRKLQELVPNMDKQTNTADMLDLAVDYIKDLQKQVKTLSDARASCTCSSSTQKSFPNPPS